MESTTAEANAAITESTTLQLQATIMKFKSKGNQGKKDLLFCLIKIKGRKRD